MIVTFAYSLYFQEIVAGGSHSGGDFYWGIAVSLSMLVCALIAPPLGAAADCTDGKKQFLLIFTIVSVLATAGLYFVHPGMILTGILLFVLANVGFEGGIVFYDALLPSLTTSRSVGRVSGYGFGMGYLGALAILALCKPLLEGGLAPVNQGNFRLAFLVSAGFFFLFSLPLFLFVKERKDKNRQKVGYIREGIRRSAKTLTHIREYPNIARFMLAFFLYNDGILTVIAFASIYAKDTLHFTIAELLFFFISVQSSAILGSLVFGVITDKIGPKKTIIITLVLWIAVVVAAYFADSKEIFYGLGFLAGISMGSSQSASRSLMVRLTPAHRTAEFFGFYDGFFGKASAIIGPLVFGILSSTLGQRPAIVFLSFFFIAGLFLIRKVEETAVV